jgi:hypothetical protein
MSLSEGLEHKIVQEEIKAARKNDMYAAVELGRSKDSHVTDDELRDFADLCYKVSLGNKITPEDFLLIEKILPSRSVFRRSFGQVEVSSLIGGTLVPRMFVNTVVNAFGASRNEKYELRTFLSDEINYDGDFNTPLYRSAYSPLYSRLMGDVQPPIVNDESTLKKRSLVEPPIVDSMDYESPLKKPTKRGGKSRKSRKSRKQRKSRKSRK